MVPLSLVTASAFTLLLETVTVPDTSVVVFEPLTVVVSSPTAVSESMLKLRVVGTEPPTPVALVDTAVKVIVVASLLTVPPETELAEYDVEPPSEFGSVMEQLESPSGAGVGVAASPVISPYICVEKLRFGYTRVAMTVYE